MICAVFRENREGYLTGFSVEGHAGYANPGDDIVCAAVSALVINTINSVEALTEASFEVNDPKDPSKEPLVFQLTSDPASCPDSELLLRSLYLGLSSIKDQPENQAYIHVSKEKN